MATRYWVGGSGSWTDATNHWASSSGGSPNASYLPTTSDDVVFDQAGSYTVTFSSDTTVTSFTVSAGTVTLSGSVNIQLYGSLALIAGTVMSSIVGVKFISTSTGYTINTNGVVLPSVYFSGVGGGWTLSSALAVTNATTFTAGTFNTGNFSVSTSSLAISGTDNKVFNIGTSTITCTGGTFINTATGATNFSTTGTGTIYCTYPSNKYLYGGGFTYPYTIRLATICYVDIKGNNTFGNLTIDTLSNLNGNRLTLYSNITITGTFTAPSLYPYCRTFIKSDTVGAQRIVSIGAISASTSDVDFMDIYVDGSAAPTNITRTGDVGGNGGITPTPAKTVYWVYSSSSGNWPSAYWALTSGGVGDVNNYPLAQDTAIIDNVAPSGSLITTMGYSNMPAIDTSSRTLPLTMDFTATNGLYCGDITLSAAISVGTYSYIYAGKRGTQNISTSGQSFYYIYVNNYGGELKLLTNLTVTSGSGGGVLSFMNGTVNLNSNSLTCKSVSYSGSTPIGVSFGTGGVINVTAGNYTTPATNFTVTGTGTINMSSSTTKSFYGGANYSGITLNNASAPVLTIFRSSTFADITNSVSPASFSFEYSQTQTVTNFSVSGVAGSLCYITSTSSGVKSTITKAGGGVVGCDYLNIKDSQVTNGNWFSGAHSVNSGNNTGWTFSAVPTGSSANFFMLF